MLSELNQTATGISGWQFINQSEANIGRVKQFLYTKQWTEYCEPGHELLPCILHLRNGTRFMPAHYVHNIHVMLNLFLEAGLFELYQLGIQWNLHRWCFKEHIDTICNDRAAKT
jgi:hypothetical protein